MAKERINLTGTQKAAVICAFLFMVLLFAGLLVNIVRRGELSARARALQAEIAQLEKEKEQNAELIADLNSQDYADAYAREQQDLKKQNEKVHKGEEQ